MRARSGGFRVVVAGLAAIAACLLLREGRPDAQGGQNGRPPTFNHDVAPILFAHCVSCHRPNDVAPMSLLTYEQARPWAKSIRAKVVAREMPPWPADRRYGRFLNEHTLTDQQIDAIATWVDAGAPEGDGVAPAPPRFVDGWTSEMDRPPDQIIEAPLGFELPATGVIPVVRAWTKLPVGKERFIEAMELRPTNRAAIHHGSVFRAKLPEGVKIGRGELWDGGPVVDAVPVQKNGAVAVLTKAPESFGTPLVFYVPNGGFLKFPKGIGKRLESDDYLLWTFHLVTSGRPERAGARLALWFSRSEVDHEAVTWTVTDHVFVDGREVPRDAGGPIIPNIPAKEPKFSVTGLMSIAEPITLYALWPHMHVRGHDLAFVLEDPKQRQQTLLSVPKYQFDWQFTYMLDRPLKIAPGSRLVAVAHYDNSASNPSNPDPNRDVAWGPQATDEMFDPFLELVYDRRNLHRMPFIDFRSEPSDGR